MMRLLRGGEEGSRAEGVSLQRLQALLHFVVRVSQGKRGVFSEASDHVVGTVCICICIISPSWPEESYDCTRWGSLMPTSST